MDEQAQADMTSFCGFNCNPGFSSGANSAFFSPVADANYDLHQRISSESSRGATSASASLSGCSASRILAARAARARS
eukprot:1840800-Pleurochrysis_carterae.AAC.1